MPVIVCTNTKCKHISKRRTRCINGDGHETLRHTCRASLINVRPATTGDEGIIEYLGYQPYECVNGRSYYDK